MKSFKILKHRNRLIEKAFIPTLVLFFILSSNLYCKAQETVSTIPTWDDSQTVQICQGGQVIVHVEGSVLNRTYLIKKTLPQPSVTIQSLTGTGGDISSNPITINDIGSFTYLVLDIPDANIVINFFINVLADPVAPTLTKFPNNTTTCAGSAVKANTQVPGSGGIQGCVDSYQYSTDGGTNWNEYIPGNDIATDGLSGTDIVKIKAYRSDPDGRGCMSSVNEVSWTVNALPDPEITGNASPCKNSMHDYATESGMSNYIWSIVNGTITSGGNTNDNTINVKWDKNVGAGSISVSYMDGNGCSSNTFSYNVDVKDLPIPTISGPEQACASNTQIYTTEAGMSNYTWSVSGGTGSSISNNIIITWGTAGPGKITVNYTNENDCTATSATEKNLIINPLPAPTISGPNSVCANSVQTYTTEEGFDDYNWWLNGGTGVPSGNSIVVTWDNNPGVAHVVAVTYSSNGCQAAAYSEYPVSIIGHVQNISTRTWYCKIQDAIDDATTGQTIEVHSGTYNENISISVEGLILMNAASDAPEIQPTTGIAITVAAENVTVEGFSINHLTLDDAYDVGLYISLFDHATIRDNIFTNNSYAIALVDAGNNNILNNTLNSNGLGIFVDGNTDGLGHYDVGSNGPFYSLSLNNIVNGNTIQNCVNLPFSFDDDGVAIYVDAACEGNNFNNNQIINNASSGYYAWKASNNVVTNNTITGNGIEGLQLMGSSGNTITGNTIDGNSTTGHATYGINIRCGALSSTANIISDNLITGNVTGIRLQDDFSTNNYVGFVTGNTITNNKIIGNTTSGLFTENTPTTSVYTAENNWWGDASGPTCIPFNTCGLGNAVSSNVDFNPWWTTETGGSTSLAVHNTTQSKFYCTIQGAINDATDGDVIEISSGTYNYTSEGISAGSQGLINVTKGVTIKAATGTRPVIDGTGVNGVFKIHPSALNSGNTVVIEGFEITGDASTGIAMTMQGCFDIAPALVVIRNNWFHGTMGGIDFWGATSYLPSGWTSAVANTEITGNKFYNMVAASGHQGFGVLIESPADWITADNAHAVKIENNEFSGMASEGSNFGTGIGIMSMQGAGIAANVSISGNSFTSDVPIGVAFANADVTNTEVTGNSFENSIYGIYAVAITNTPITAKCNWFGTTGPSGVSALISGDVNYTPWLTDGTDASSEGIGFQPVVSCDETVPLAGQLTMITNKHAAPGIQISAPVNGMYEITTPLSFNGVDVFQSLSVIVTDDNLNTQNVPVIINGTQNGEMVYDANAQIWNYENQTIEPEFQDGSQTLTATFIDNAGNTTPLILKFTTDATVPMAGQLVMITKSHPEPGLQVTVPVDGVYAIATPLSFNGLDVFQSLSIVVTDLNLNTANVPVYINSIENGYMQYDANEGIWNYAGQSGAPTFTDGLQTLTATFADNVGNTTSLQLTFITDATAPVITQSGNSTVFLCQNNEYIDDGATAADITAGDLTNNIVTGGDVITSENPGTYTITYNVTDAAGNPAPEVIRTVVVNPNPTFSGLTTNATSPVCYGTAISFTANGLLNGTNQFTYTITGTGPGLPINNAVATANVTGGSYMFPAPVHPYAPGEYLVTINSITIDDCTTDFLENNSVNFTVNPLPTASISGELESCVSTKLIAETDASSPSFVWYKGTEPIDGQISSSLDVIESGEYNVKVTNGITNCNAISDVVSVIIYPETVAGAVTGGTSVCSGSTSGELTLGTHTGDVTRWESSVDPFTTWTPIANTTDAYTSGALTATTKFRAIVKSGVCSEVPSTETTVTVYGTVITSGVVDGFSDLTLCDGGNPQAFNVGNAIGGDGNYSYQWEESVNGSGTWVNATAQVGTSTTDLSFNPPALFATVTTVQYRLKISDGCGNIGYSTIKTYTVIPDQIPPTIFATPQSGSTICVGSTVFATFGSGSGGTGTSTDKYEFRINGGTWEKYINGTDIVATPEMVGPNTISIRSYRESSGTGCDETYNVVQWSVNSLPEVYTVGGGGANCFDGSGVSITLSGSETGITYELWKDGSATGTTLAGTGIVLSFDHVMAEGDYRVKATDDEFGCVNTMNGNVTVSVRPEFTAGEIKITGESISYLGDPVRIESEIAASGGDENITYKWQSSIDGTNFTDIPNSDAASYDPSNLMQTTWFKRLAKDGTCNPTFTESAGVYEVTISEDVALQYLQDNTHLTTVSGTISDLTATFPASIPPVILAEPYKINSKMTLSGDVVPAGSTVDIQVTVDGAGPISYVTGAPIPSSPFWITDLNGGTPSDFNTTYGGKIELYSITIHGGGGNPLDLNGMVKVESIISKNGFSTNTVLDEISLNWTIPADEAAALAWLQDNTHLTTVSGTISDLSATFPASIPPVIITEPYKINSKMTLSGDVVPVGSTVDIQVTVDGAGPISYVTGATIPEGPFWITDLNGESPSDFNATYGGKIEFYSITIHGGGGNPLDLNGMVKVESIISKDGFSTNIVLDNISLNWTIPADEAAALSWLQNNTHLTTVSGTISDLTATFPASIPPVILAEPYKINSKMTLSGDIVPTGSTVDIQVTVDGAGPISYVTGAPIPTSPFWITDLKGEFPSDFNSTYGGKIEFYNITIHGGGGNPFALNGVVKIESIISKNGFSTNIVLDEISLNWAIPDAIALPLTVTGFTANSEPMTGSLVDGYELNTDNNPATNYMLQFDSGSEASEPMKDEVAGLYLSPTAGQTDELVAYYESKPIEYQAYLNTAAAGISPFAFIKTGGTTLRILDGAQYTLNSQTETDMIVPGNFPLGTYSVTGIVHDFAENPTPVTYIVVVAGDRVKPEITLTGDANISICQGESYEDAGATATDDIDGDISSNIEVVNSVDKDIPNTYTITYNVSDAAGNAATEVIRTVVVKPNPTISGVNVSDESACFGSSVDFTINGLLNGSTDFVYSIAFNRETPVETAENGILVSNGTARFTVDDPAVGNYVIQIISAVVNGCSANFQNYHTAEFTVHPIPEAPTVAVVDNHNGTSTLTASGYEGTLLWSTNETANQITVNTGGDYTVTQTVNGCTSPVGSGFVNPSPTTNILAPIQETCGVYKVDVTVQDFINIGSISLKLNFDPQVLEYQNADINGEVANPFFDGNNTIGQFTFSYSGSGIGLPDDAILFSLHFLVKAGIPEATTPLSWSKVAAHCEYAGATGVPVYFSSFADNMISVSNCTISGKLVYNNVTQTPMNKVELTLSPVNSKVTTGEDGSYSFTGLHDGTYTIAVTDNKKEVGYINSTDAGAANSWTSAGGAIDYVKFLAGDVAENNLYINTTDAQRIQKFFVNGTPFDKESWCYWKKGDMISNNYGTKPVNFDVTVGGANVVGFDMFGMCTGDFNGSFTPTTLKSTNSFVKLNSYSSLQVGPSQEFELPIRSEHSLEIGAVSLIIQLPSDLLKVQHISIKDSNVPVDWIQKGDELRIGWYSSESVGIREGESLLTLRLFASAEFTNGENVEISLKSNLLNELADASFDRIQGVKLEVSKIFSLATDIPDKLENKALLISNYPNPFKNSTTIDYTLPVDGKVSIVIYNQLQQVITTLVDENQTAGQHTVRMDSKYITPGIYFAKIRLTNKDVDSFGTVKLSVLK